MEVNKTLLTKNQLANIFNELSLYYSNSSPYSGYTKEQISVVTGIYYDSLKYYKEEHIRRKMKNHIQKSTFFPKVCDLIPTANEMRGNP
jgi:hypothetical protein